VSFIAAAWVWWGLPNDPALAKFLKPKEKEVMLARDRQRLEYLGSLNFEWVEVGRALKDPKVWLWYVNPFFFLIYKPLIEPNTPSALIQFFQDIILYGFSTFLPSILKLDLNFNAMEAQYLSVPVYLLGGIVFFVSSSPHQCCGNEERKLTLLFRPLQSWEINISCEAL
jgi:hypothetical protein